VTEQKNNIYLVTGFDQNYLARATAYLETMNQKSNVKNIVVTLDFDITPEYKSKFQSIRFVKIQSSQIRSPNPNKCMQHGGFLNALSSLHETSVVIFTDSDINVQRGFTDEELSMFTGFKDNDIGVSYNKTKDYSLLDELKLLKPKVAVEELLEKYPEISELTVFNTGVIVANYKTYKRLYGLYNSHWKGFKDLFEHYAKQQWLLSYLIHKYFRPRILPFTIHTHGHYPVQIQIKGEVGYKFCIDSEVVVLNHAIPHHTDKLIKQLTKKIKSQSRLLKKLVVVLVILSLVCIFLIIKSFILE